MQKKKEKKEKFLAEKRSKKRKNINDLPTDINDERRHEDELSCNDKSKELIKKKKTLKKIRLTIKNKSNNHKISILSLEIK